MIPQLIVFDLAGTTVKDNRDVHRVLRDALAEHGVDISLNDANDVMGIPKPIAIEELLLKRYLGRRPIDGLWIQEIHQLFVAKMREFYLTNPYVSEVPGASDTFFQLHAAGIRVATDTGFDRPITDPLLQRMGWITQGLVDATVTSDEVAKGRPHPDMIFEAMKRTGVTDLSRVAKVGDTPSDLGEGTAAKCGWVIGVTSGAFTRDQLSREPHTHLIDSIPEILEILNIAN